MVYRELRRAWRGADPRFKTVVSLCWPVWATLPFLMAAEPVTLIAHWRYYVMIPAGLLLLAVGRGWYKMRPMWRDLDERIERMRAEDAKREFDEAERKRKAFEDSLRATERDLRGPGLDGRI